MRSRLVFTGVSLLAAFAVACGAGPVDGMPRTVDAPAPATAGIGETVTLANRPRDSMVEITLTDAKWHAVEPGQLGSLPDHGMYLVVRVTVVCTHGTYHANPYNFSFVAADGTVFEHTWTVGFEPDLNAVDLTSGQRTSGKIVFDVPPTAIPGGRVRIDGMGRDFDKPAAFWHL